MPPEPSPDDHHKKPVRRWRLKPRRVGIALGFVAASSYASFLLTPAGLGERRPGAQGIGHEGIECESCHRQAEGNIRQQLQANARYILGLRSHQADFGSQPVTNESCVRCHGRPNDRHPAGRFLEPRFTEARSEVGAHLCRSCHGEHDGRRLDNEGDFCGSCHGEMVVDGDPLDVSHQELADSERFDTCLGCHDFHGNHDRDIPERMEQRISNVALEDYFASGPSPYGEERLFPPLTESDLMGGGPGEGHRTLPPTGADSWLPASESELEALDTTEGSVGERDMAEGAESTGEEGGRGTAPERRHGAVTRRRAAESAPDASTRTSARDAQELSPQLPAEVESADMEPPDTEAEATEAEATEAEATEAETAEAETTEAETAEAETAEASESTSTDTAQ